MPARFMLSLLLVEALNGAPMAKRKPRDIYTDWEDENVHVQLTGEGWLRAIEANQKALRIAQEALERAKARAQRNRRNGEVR